MRATLRLLVFPLLVAAILPGAARAQGDVEISIERHARLTADGGIVFRVHVTCGPLPGSEDFREGFAGAVQQKTGAEGEGGLSPDVICDGEERVYTAGVSSFTESVFRRGPAHANAAVIACNSVGEGQVCVQGSAQRRVVVAGRLVG
jgi:hypothetical protein